MKDMRDSLAQQLRSVPNPAWVQSKLRDDSTGLLVRWLPIASIELRQAGSGLQIGLSDQGQWVVAAADGTVANVESADEYLPLFPLLEMPLDEARAVLATELRARRLPEEWLHAFPFDGLVVAALTARSKFWPGLALSWAAALHGSERVIAALDVVQKLGLTQHQRHEAARILRARRHQ